MKLVIAEKPSVAADLARALPGSFKEQDGYWEGPDHLVSWAVGHLLELAQPEDYDPALKAWSLASLPILPEKFERRPRKGQTNQLRLLKRLAERKDVTEIVNACDAAREGELIFREIEEYMGTGKPVSRLWLQSMTAAAIKTAFAQIKPSTEYDGLGAAAYSRAESDWLIGMNATRGLTKRLKGRKEIGVWSAGRVQTPTLALLVHRENKVLAHVPKSYWRLTGKFNAAGHDYESQYKSAAARDTEKIWSQEEAEKIAAVCRQGKNAAAVEEVSESQRAVPSLHSLTSLQKEANSRFGLSARRTLSAAQRLYEAHKVATYPRTDSTCLPNDYRGHVNAVIADVATNAFFIAFSEPDRHAGMVEAAQTLQREGLGNQSRVFNDAGVSDHFAVIPTGTLPASPLGGDDAKVFELILRRFLAAMMGPSTWQKVVRETRFPDPAAPGGNWIFTVESERLAVPGWQLVDRRPGKEQLLPPLGVPPGTPALAKVKEIEVVADATKPPKRYTEAGLLKAMETASDIDLDQHDELDDEEALQMLKAKGLGTPATRAETIESLIEKGYVLRSGKSLRAGAKGIQLIDLLERIHADHLAKAQLTAEMEFHLYQVERGQRQRADYMQEVVDSVKTLVKSLQEFEYDDLYRGSKPVGACPKCGQPVNEGLKGYRCGRPGKAAKFEIALKGAGKETKVPIAKSGAAAEKAALKLEGVTAAVLNAKRTNATLTLELSAPVLADEFGAKAEAALMAAVPAGSLKDVDVEAVGSDACGFTVWKEYRGRFVNREVAAKLLTEGDTGPLDGFVSQRGDTYAGRLRLNADKIVEFEVVRGWSSGDEDGGRAPEPELISLPVDATPYVADPLGKGMVIETPTHFVSSEKGGVKVPRTICKRTMTREDCLPLFDPAVKHTNWIEDFTSRKGRPFTARIILKPDGKHGFEFKPREPGAKGGKGGKGGGWKRGKKGAAAKAGAGAEAEAPAAS